MSVGSPRPAGGARAIGARALPATEVVGAAAVGAAAAASRSGGGGDAPGRSTPPLRPPRVSCRGGDGPQRRRRRSRRDRTLYRPRRQPGGRRCGDSGSQRRRRPRSACWRRHPAQRQIGGGWYRSHSGAKAARPWRRALADASYQQLWAAARQAGRRPARHTPDVASPPTPNAGGGRRRPPRGNPWWNPTPISGRPCRRRRHLTACPAWRSRSPALRRRPSFSQRSAATCPPAACGPQRTVDATT